jgi:multisubunit Na+/H+ antiporter MnhC subunit
MTPIVIGIALLAVTLFLTCADAGSADRRGFPRSRRKK